MTCGPKAPKCLREGAQLPVLESEELPVSRGRGLVRLLSSREVGAASSNGRKRSRNGKTRPEMTGNDNIRQKAMRSVNCMY